MALIIILQSVLNIALSEETSAPTGPRRALVSITLHSSLKIACDYSTIPVIPSTVSNTFVIYVVPPAAARIFRCLIQSDQSRIGEGPGLSGAFRFCQSVRYLLETRRALVNLFNRIPWLTKIHIRRHRNDSEYHHVHGRIMPDATGTTTPQLRMSPPFCLGRTLCYSLRPLKRSIFILSQCAMFAKSFPWTLT